MKYSDFYSATANFECPNMVSVGIDLNVQIDDDRPFYMKMADSDYLELATAFRRQPGDCAHLFFDLHHEEELAYGDYEFALFDGARCVMVFTAKRSEARDVVRMRRRKPLSCYEYTISVEEMREASGNLEEDFEDDEDEHFDYIVCDDSEEVTDGTAATIEETGKTGENPEEESEETENEPNDLEKLLAELETATDDTETAADDAETTLFELMSDIDMLEGMDEIKTQLEDLFCLMKMNAMRDKMGILCTAPTKRFHCLFLGNPGTGKTTVAKLIGRVFRRLGVLSKGEVCIHSRTDLVGKFIGDTEDKMTQVIDESRGNVLFIDEAYTLFNGRSDEKSDYGNIVINALLPVLTEPNPDMVIILAGYPEEMKRMLDSNPGLRDRFPQVFRFEDYDADTLYKIGVRKLLSMDFRMTPEAADTFRQNIRKHWERRDRNFANARWIENIVETGIVQSVARRLFADDATSPTEEQLRRIEREDVEEGFRRICDRRVADAMKEKRPIGFSMNR